MRCHPGQEGRHDATPPGQAHVPRLDARARPHVGPPADLATAHTRNPRGSGLTSGSHRAGHTTRVTYPRAARSEKETREQARLTRPSAPPLTHTSEPQSVAQIRGACACSRLPAPARHRPAPPTARQRRHAPATAAADVRSGPPVGLGAAGIAWPGGLFAGSGRGYATAWGTGPSSQTSVCTIVDHDGWRGTSGRPRTIVAAGA